MLSTIYRAGFLPSLGYNIVLNKLNIREWHNRINDKIILGALPFKSGLHHLIDEESVAGVVSMNENFELTWLRRWVCNREDWLENNVKFLQLQTQDIFETPSQDKLKAGVEFIMSFDENPNQCVYIHCKAGRTRSATLAACYLMKKNNWTPEQAYELLKSKRPQTALHKPQWEAMRIFYKEQIQHNISE